MDKNEKIKLWDNFCIKNNVSYNKAPLFDSSDLIVQTKNIGKTSIRKVLKRSKEMEDLVIREKNLIVDDFKKDTKIYDGLIYLMFYQNNEKVIPLYIGKAEKYGKKNHNLSANLNFEKSKEAFARWGDNYAYHIGDLSAVVLPDHKDNYKTTKYANWADSMFEKYPTTQPKLKQEVYFWTKAWSSEDISIWEDYGNVKLTFLEYLLIGIASDIFPNNLLNTEGQNR